MTVKGGATWIGMAVTKDDTGALSAATVGPAGTLYLNGVANGAAVAIAGANPYSWSVVLPALAAGDCVSMYLTATVDLIATASVVAEDVADGNYVSDVATTIGVAGAGLTALGDVRLANLDAAVSTRSVYAGGAVASVTGSVGGNVTGSVGSVVGLTNVTISDQVWDEAIAGHLGAGSTGAALNAAGAAGDPWAIPLPGAYGAGTAGFIIGNLVASTASAVWAWGSRTLTSLATYLIGSVRQYWSINFSLSACQGETVVADVVIQTSAGSPMDITDFTVIWVLSQTRGSAPLLTKSTTLGTVIFTDALHGGIQFTITSAETDALAAETYAMEIHIKAPAPGSREYCAMHGRMEITASSIGAI